MLILGETTYRSTFTRFGLTGADRLRHIYILGKTGSGKSTLLENLVAQDLAREPTERSHAVATASRAAHPGGRAPGFALLDPHGSLVSSVLALVPAWRTNDILLFDPADEAHPISFNIFRQGRRQSALSTGRRTGESCDLAEGPPLQDTALIASSIISVFKKQWATSWGPRLEHVLRNAILAVADDERASLVFLYRFLTDAKLRDRVVEKTTDPLVRQFWTREFAGYREALKSEATAPVLNKLGAFVSSPKVRAIVGQTKSRVDLGELMDDGRIILANLATGAIGEDAAHLLGGLLLSSLQLAAMGREHTKVPFTVYIDEFQHFVTESLATLLSESRKFGVGLVLAHQYLGQLPLELRGAVLGNVGSTVVFRVGAEDAQLLEYELFPPFSAGDIQRLPNYHAAVKLLARGQQLDPFSARTLPPPVPSPESQERVAIIRRQSRARYASCKSKVDREIRQTLGV